MGTRVVDISAGHFARGKYKDVSGMEVDALSANLWIMIQNHPETTLSIRVLKGQTIFFMECKLQILRVEMDQPGIGFVEFEITKNEQTDTPVKKGE
jgi:hypothetical protein